MKVSVLIPIYNAERYLAEAIGSVIGQSFKDFEIVAVNDGSKDGSLEILEDIAAREPRLRIVSRPNTGIVGALNDGLAVCKAPYIARMDADDFMLPGRLVAQVAHLDKNPDCVVVGSLVQYMDPDGNLQRSSEHALNHKTIERELLAGFGDALNHPAVMIRREALQAIGGYRPECQWAEDLDLYLRLARLGKLENLNQVLLRYRVHAASVSRTRAEEQKQATIRALTDAHKDRNIPLPPNFSGDFTSLYPSVRPELRGWVQLSQGDRMGALSTAWRTLAAGRIRWSLRLTAAALRGR